MAEAKIDLQSRLEYAIFCVAFFCLATLPRPLALWLGAQLGSLLYCVAVPQRRIAMINLAMAFPERPPSEHRRILRASCRNLGRAVAEFCHLQALTLDTLPLYVAMADARAWERIFERPDDSGVVIVTGHFGNWELLSYLHGMLGQPITLVYKPMRNKLFDARLHEIRSQSGTCVVPKGSAARTAMRTLKQREVLVIPSDQNQRRSEGVFVEVFGRLACTNPGAARLAMRTGATIIPVFLVRQGESDVHRLEVLPDIELVDSGDRERDIVTNTQRCSDAISGMIRRYPEQWIWFHRRWRTRPEGESPIY